MIDLHSHILYGIDDGADNIDQSVKLLEFEMKDGVDTVALTPHYYIEKDDSIEFIKRRDERAANLTKRCIECAIQIRLIFGAEVHLSPQLLFLPNLREFCYTGTDYMLVELPTEYYFDWIHKTLFELELNGVHPVIAHIERCPYFFENLNLLEKMISSGCIAQINADSLIFGGRHRLRFFMDLIRRRLIQVIATDAHSAVLRPPRLKDAMDIAVKQMGIDTREYFYMNAAAVLMPSDRKTCCLKGSIL